MTPAPHDHERDLARTLARQADRLAEHGSPLQLDQVLSRAGEIRRGRRMRASMVMAAVVLAVAVPVGITTLTSNDPSRKETPGFAATPSATPKDNRPIGLGEYTAGSSPKTGYTLDGTLFHDGRETDIGAGNVSYLEKVTGGFLIGQSDDSGATTVTTGRFVADDGTVSDQTWILSTNFVASAGGNVGALVETDGTVITVENGRGTEAGELPSTSTYKTVAVDGESCPDDCIIWVVETDETPGVWRIVPGLPPEKVTDRDGLMTVDGNGNYVRQVAYDDAEGGTYAYFDADGRQLWTTTTYSPRAFSPDGKYLSAGPQYRDNNESQVTILDSATGKPVTDLKTVAVSTGGANTSVYETVWEDNTHLLATVTSGEDYAVVRVDLSGAREYAVAKDGPADPFAIPLRLG